MSKVKEPVKCTNRTAKITVELTKGAVMPIKAHKTDAGFDLVASEDTTLWFNKPKLVHTGVKIKLPRGTVGDIRPRSSLNKQGVYVAYGTIDEGYTGELLVCMSAFHHKIKKGDKIAQLVVLSRSATTMQTGSVSTIKTARGTGGFGSTGKAVSATPRP